MSDIPFRTLLLDVQGRNVAAGLSVIDYPGRLEWLRDPSGTRGLPDVDLTREIVVVLTTGHRPSGGYQIEIVGMADDDGTLVVHGVERRLGPGHGATMAETFPIHAVAIPRRPEGPLRLVLDMTWW